MYGTEQSISPERITFILGGGLNSLSAYYLVVVNEENQSR